MTGQTVEKRGTALLRAHLLQAGRTTVDSDVKTFDLIVDGRYAEVKCKSKPFSAFDFIGLTDNQFDALQNDVDYLLFVVCNVADPTNVEIYEVPARDLLAFEPKVERTYYWHKTQMRRILGIS